jgi:putative tricarboxylic transport membrane protein
VRFTNWRGVVAPPGLSETDSRRLVELFADLHTTPAWKDALQRNGWTDAFSTGDEFGTFLREQNDQVATVLKELGLA